MVIAKRDAVFGKPNMAFYFTDDNGCMKKCITYLKSSLCFLNCGIIFTPIERKSKSALEYISCRLLMLTTSKQWGRGNGQGKEPLRSYFLHSPADLGYSCIFHLWIQIVHYAFLIEVCFCTIVEKENFILDYRSCSFLMLIISTQWPHLNDQRKRVLASPFFYSDSDGSIGFIQPSNTKSALSSIVVNWKQGWC